MSNHNLKPQETELSCGGDFAALEDGAVFHVPAAAFLAAGRPALKADPITAKAQQAKLTAQEPELFAAQADPRAAGVKLSPAEIARLPPRSGTVNFKELSQMLLCTLPQRLQHYAELSFRLHRDSVSAASALKEPQLYDLRQPLTDQVMSIRSGRESSLTAALTACCRSPLELLCSLSRGDPGIIYEAMKRAVLHQPPEQQYYFLSPGDIRLHLGLCLYAYGTPANYVSQVLCLSAKQLRLCRPLMGQDAVQQVSTLGTQDKERHDPRTVLLLTIAVNFYGIIVSRLAGADPLLSHLARARTLPLDDYAAIGAYDCMRTLLHLSYCVPWMRSEDSLCVPGFKLFHRSLKLFLSRQLDFVHCPHAGCGAQYLPSFKRVRRAAGMLLKTGAAACPACALRAQMQADEQRGRSANSAYLP